MRRQLPLIVLTAALLSPAVVQAAKPPAASVTVTATPTTITFGRTTTLSGQLTGGKSVAAETVDVQADVAPFEGHFVDVASATTDPTGHWTTTHATTALTRYRARASTSPPTESTTTVDVAVRLRVGMRVSDRTPARGQRVKFSGRVAPAHDGAAVRIQRRRADGHWVTVARTTLLDAGTDVSRYAKRVRVRRTGRYRVRALSGDTDHLTGTSRKRKLTVSG